MNRYITELSIDSAQESLNSAKISDIWNKRGYMTIESSSEKTAGIGER